MNKEIKIEVSWKLKEEHDCFDADVFLLILDENHFLPRRYDIVFYNLHHHRSGAVHRLNKEKELLDYEENFKIYPYKLPQCFNEIEILLSVYEAQKREIHLSEIQEIKLDIYVDENKIGTYFYDNFVKDANSIDLGCLTFRDSVAFEPKKLYRTESNISDLTPYYGLKTWKE